MPLYYSDIGRCPASSLLCAPRTALHFWRLIRQIPNSGSMYAATEWSAWVSVGGLEEKVLIPEQMQET